ncbi:hypothetical protein [Spongiimicrobium salis]|uniref:hypothetical protein n=1 Tax=Spongiimicrobium salis TaxID=1667022 RepID=UPI00374CAC10
MKKLKVQVLTGTALKNISGGEMKTFQGKVAGVQVTGTGGGLGAGSRIQLRGNRS